MVNAELLAALASPEPEPEQHQQQQQSPPQPTRAASPPQLPPSGPPPRAPAGAALARRRTASEFVQATTGVSPPYTSDAAFRAALRDGALLCKLAATVWGPDAVEAASGAGAFMAALTARVSSLPHDCRFTAADLDAAEDVPAVTNCLLFVRTLASHGGAGGGGGGAAMSAVAALLDGGSGGSSSGGGALPSTPPPQHRGGSLRASLSGALPPGSAAAGTPPIGHGGMTPRLSPFATSSPGGGGGGGNAGGGRVSVSPLTDSHGGLMMSGQAALRSSLYGSSLNAATHKSVQAAAGVTKLMQQCTSMLKERMFPSSSDGGSSSSSGNGGGSSGGGNGAAAAAAARGNHNGGMSPAGVGPDSAMKALGPVLEGVLGHLTEEYEKRLLAKDHDLSRAGDARRRAEDEVERLRRELAAARREADARNAAAAAAAAEANSADAAATRAALADASARCAALEAELRAARAQLADAEAGVEAVAAPLRRENERMRGRLGELEGVDARYRRALEDNRRLYNTVQDLKGSIRVFCRIRPPGATGDTSASIVDAGLEGELAVYDPGAANGQRRLFKVDRVFDAAADQASVYEDTQPLIRSVLDGYNVCIFAYGQTGSGKTHTMSGTGVDQHEGRGINYRALDDLFGIRADRADECEYTFRVQMLEIYNEALRDLLVDPSSRPGSGGSGSTTTTGGSGSGSGSSNSNRLDILATKESGCNVPGATQVDVGCGADVLALMRRGAANRATGETRMNDRSSRSHQILTVIVDGVNHVTKARSHGCLHLVDLAGSERVAKSEATGDRLVEAQHINRSLSALGDVMAALASKDSRHVPFRNSKLTQLLQDSLCGNAKVMMFMHVSPEANQLGETVSTLKFASRVSEITLGAAKKNVVSGKVFEAHEEATRAARAAECKEAALRQLHAALGAREAAEAALQREVEALKAELRAAREEAAAAREEAAAAAAHAAQHAHAHPQQPAAATRLAAAPEPLSQQQQQQQQQQRQQRHSPGAAAASPGSPGKLPLPRVDRTPPRDQDDTLGGGGSGGGGVPGGARSEASLLGGEHHIITEPAPRGGRLSSSSGGGGGGRLSFGGGGGGGRASLPPRESTSAMKHMERLSAARTAGGYSSGGGIAAAGSISSGRSSTSGGGSSGGGAAGRASLAGGAGAPLDRPLTTRVAGKPRPSEAGATAAPAGSLSMRAGGVYSSGRASTAAFGSTGATTARVTATSRPGGRWK